MKKAFLFLLLPFSFCQGQTPVAPVTGWLTTVDSATQQIVLRWQASADSAVIGYHICTGSSDTGCFDYGTVLGRLDTSYICLDHSPLEQHQYRLHAFDSTDNVSELTPFFGNVVLTAEVPDCEKTVRCHWSPYEGAPKAHTYERLEYQLEIIREPHDTAFMVLTGREEGEPLEWIFDLPESATRVWLRVVVSITNDNYFRSESNIVMVERRTIDTASVVAITDIEYDSIHTVVNLTCEVDTGFEYTLYRSIDGSPWRRVESFHPRQSPFHYTDSNINPYDSLHCYQLEVFDPCGLNPRYSNTAWVVVPTPPSPLAWFPNTIVVGDDRNGTFLPIIRGLKGNLYQLTIYNRMGLLVYYTEDQDAGWTPPSQTPQGAYTYFLRCRYNTGDIKTYAGTVVLIH